LLLAFIPRHLQIITAYGIKKHEFRMMLKEAAHLEDPSVDVMIILKLILRKWDGAWIGLIWLRIETGERLLQMR
jgi:hypothetical protein